jgi:putative tricarboxylic transport membrane protein
MSAHMRDALVGFGTAILFGYMLLVAIPAQIRVPESVAVAALSPAFWPSVVAGLAIALGLILGLKAVVMAARVRTATKADRTPRQKTWPRLAVIGIMFGYYFMLDIIGIVAASILVLPVLIWLFGERRMVLLVPTAVLLPVGLYYFFTRMANVPLPLGVFS